MIYGKLPVAFLSAISSEKKGSTNSFIAGYILEHLDDVRNMGIRELAAACGVSLSSVSRFCRMIGLEGFEELRGLLVSSEFHFDGPVSPSELSRRITDSITAVQTSIDINAIRELCDDIHSHSKVAAFGLLKASAAAIDLQSDMLMMGKYIHTSVPFSQQSEYIAGSDAGDLIIIFSYTGSYFEYEEFRSVKDKLKNPKIWLISGKDKPQPKFVDRAIIFDSRLDQAGHPYQLQFVSGLIANECAKRYR